MTPAPAATASGPLAGLRVIELAHVMAGPTCGLMLADLGADVIKVEKIPDGDDSRRFAPPTIEGESAAFLMLNRHKRGVALDLKTEGGREVLRRLLKRTDVVIENFRRGALERLGFGYDALRRDNPGLIYCDISGFGRDGPYADRPGLDLIAQAMSGLTSITGEGPGRPPVKLGPPATDIVAGILAAMGIAAAYAHRLKTGQGQRVETSLMEAGIALTYWQSAMALATGQSPAPLGSAHPLSAPYQAFETLDGWIVVGAPSQTLWLRLLAAIETPELANDTRFADNPTRKRNEADLIALLAPIFRRRPSDEWLPRLAAAGIPAGPVNSIADMLEDPQTLAREMVVEVGHSRLGMVKTLGCPVKFSDTPASIGQGAPLLGEHTRAVLRDHGYSTAEIDGLIAAGALREADGLQGS